MATIVGTSGNDNLTSTAEDDSIDGLGGNDTINMPASGYGVDVVNGGSGNDSLFFNFAGAVAILVDFGAGTVSGGAGSVAFSGIERVVATFGDDHLIGAAGAQNLSSVGGNDTLEGRAGNDWLWGGGGADRFVFHEAGNANADNFGDFGSGTDKIVLDAAVFDALGAEGNFAAGDGRFWAAAGATSGHDADDRLIYNTTTRQIFYDADGNGSSAAQLVGTLQSGATLAATDIVVEGGGTLPPGGATEGDDVIVGTEGDDTIDALGGNDAIFALGGADMLIGGSGNDEINTEGVDDDVDGGTGTDTQIVEIGTPPDFDWQIAAGAGVENLVVRGYSQSSINPDFPRVAFGNELANVIRDEGPGGLVLIGEGGNDTLIGGSGENAFFAPLGSDVIDGGGGTDALVFLGSGAATVDFGTGTATVAGGSASFTNIEEAYGSTSDDVMRARSSAVRLLGDAGDDTLIGGAGDDYLSADTGWDPQTVANGDDNLSGGGGDDYLEGLFGTDVLNGGTGNDRLLGDFIAARNPVLDHFVFDAPAGSANADTVLDFISGIDQLDLDGGVMPALGASGGFAAGDARFASNASGAAGDASDRVVYDTTNGQLWYDADGNGAGAALLIATLDGAPPLAATDIEVINGGGGGGGGGEHIVGTSGNDTLNGTAGNDHIEALGGNDTVNVVPADGYGDDLVDGGAGTDSLFFNFAGATAILADFADGLVTSSAGSVTFSSVERVVATVANDHLIGAFGAQNLSGVGGNDILEGSTGNDWLWGGGGLDSFVFREFGNANADRIGDFASGSDTIALDNTAMAALGADGDFSAGDGRFRAAAGATGGADASDRMIYNTSTGQLYYDADGSGAGASQLIATLQGAPGVTATDISVI